MFLLIRHAESTWNAEGRWQGQADPPLSPTGRAQAARLARALAGAQLDLLLSSDLARALETARRVGLPHGLVPTPDARLREIDLGRWSGLRREEIRACDPDGLSRFDAGDPDARPEGGETRRELRLRVRGAMAEIAARCAGRRVGVVTHLGVIRALLPGAEPENAAAIETTAPGLAAP